MELKEYLNSINYDKKPLLDNNETAEKLYPAFIVNKCLSFFIDTIFHANEMNCHPWLDKKAQFDFHRQSVRKKKRYCSWIKKDIEQKIAIIREVYGYNESKAIEVLNMFDSEQITVLKNRLEHGGIKKSE